jgi:hypothetical protein
MLTVLVILAILALLTCIAAAMNKCPIWVPVVLLCLYALLQQLPVGHSS